MSPALHLGFAMTPSAGRDGSSGVEVEVRPNSNQIGDRAITKKPMMVLECLAETPGVVVESQVLMDQVWGHRHGSDESLKRCIHQLRQALQDKPSDPRFIETIPTRGYRLIASVRALSSESPAGGEAPSDATRRKMMRTAMVYLVIVLLLSQGLALVPEDIAAKLGLVGRFRPVLITLLWLGLPAALLLTWLRERESTTRTGSPRAEPRNRRDLAFVVLLTAVFAGLSFSLLSDRGDRGAVVGSKTIAVLPFENVTGEEQNDWLGRGIAEDVLNLLTRIEGLRVAARTSSFRDGLAGDVREIGAALNVRYLLEGSVRRSPDQLRVTAQLIDTTSGFRRWSATYNRTVDDVFLIQDEIAAEVVKALQLALPVDLQMQRAQAPTKSIAAYDYFLQARSFLVGPTTRSSVTSAERFFQRAIEHDPEFAEAYAGLCNTSVLQLESYRAAQIEPTARSACFKAVELAEDSPVTRTALGNFYRTTGEYEKALEEFQGVAETDSRHVGAYLGLGRTYAALNQPEEAEKAFLRAIEVQPDARRTHSNYAKFLFEHGRYEEAAESYGRVIEEDPDNVTALNGIGAAMYLAGDIDSAAAAYRKVVEIQPTRDAYSNIGSLYYYNGVSDPGLYEDAAAIYREAIRLAPQDHRVWGNLGDAASQIKGPDAALEAKAAYGQALELAAAELERLKADQGSAAPKDGASTPALTFTTVAVAHYAAGMGDEAKARAAIASYANALAGNGERPIDGVRRHQRPLWCCLGIRSFGGAG